MLAPDRFFGFESLINQWRRSPTSLAGGSAGIVDGTFGPLGVEEGHGAVEHDEHALVAVVMPGGVDMPGADVPRAGVATEDAAGGLGDFGGFGGPILLPESQRNNPIAFADHMACWSAWNAWRPDGHSGFQPTSFVVKREVFESVGGYDTELRVLEDWDLQIRIERSRQLEEGPGAPIRPVWFIQSLGVAHSARSSFLRTLKHSWYWGLPSREGWIQRSGASVTALERPVLRWLGLPRLFIGRSLHPVKTAWRVSTWRTIISMPFLLLTLLVWSIAVIVGQGQPDSDHEAPI